MNTKSQTPTRIRIAEDEVQQQPVRQPQRKEPNKNVLRILRFGMLISGAVILVLALMLVLLPMIKINKIVVEGNDYYDDAAVAQMAGIAEGDELFGWDMQKACDAIMAAYPYAGDIYISINFLTVKIEIVEKPTVMYAAHQDQYFSFDRDLRVLEIKQNGEESFSPFLRVKLPDVLSLQKGRTVQFVNSAEDLSYITQLLDVLAEYNLLESVTYVDFSERFLLSFVLSNSVRVEIGKLYDIDTKMIAAQQNLRNHQTVGASYAVIDVSNTSKPTYQIITADELFE